MDDLIAFYRARLDEDEQTARRIKATRHGALIVAPGDGESPSVFEVGGGRLLAEVEAKRRIVDACARRGLELSEINWAVRVLALPYADHDDYQEKWKP